MCVSGRAAARRGILRAGDVEGPDEEAAGPASPAGTDGEELMLTP
ncbi:hypothetical protein HMPREF0321_2134 [Dermacoccus sp. Ellin185]|nr:hypothetical protein HMPREF0321_2134 [Dermacoccus sp. Ellin185]